MPRRRNSAKSRKIKAEFLRQKRGASREQRQTDSKSVSTTPQRRVIIIDQPSSNQEPERISPTPDEEEFLQITIDPSDQL